MARSDRPQYLHRHAPPRARQGREDEGCHNRSEAPRTRVLHARSARLHEGRHTSESAGRVQDLQVPEGQGAPHRRARAQDVLDDADHGAGPGGIHGSAGAPGVVTGGAQPRSSTDLASRPLHSPQEERTPRSTTKRKEGAFATPDLRSHLASRTRGASHRQEIGPSNAPDREERRQVMERPEQLDGPSSQILGAPTA